MCIMELCSIVNTCYLSYCHQCHVPLQCCSWRYQCISISEQAVKEQFSDADYDLTARRKVKFQNTTRDPAIEIKFNRSLPNGWKITRESQSKVVYLNETPHIVLLHLINNFIATFLNLSCRFAPVKFTSGVMSGSIWNSCTERKCTHQGLP